MLIKTSGSELVMSGAGRTISTAECWEQYPGLARVSHTSGGRRWTNTCQTPLGDSRQARISTSFTAISDSQISFDETGQYQLVLKGQNCTASVRRTRTLTLIEREGAPAPARSVETQASAARPVPVPRCATTGLPERLEVRPSRKLMRPGDTFSFRAVVVDRPGCPLDIVPSWRVVTGGKAIALLAPGKVKVAETAPEGQVRLQVSVGDRAVGVAVEVVTRERYDALLSRGSFNAEGESAEAAVARIAGESIGAPSSVAREQARGRKTVFVLLIGALALMSGVIGLLFVGRSRKQKRAALAMTARSPSRPAEKSPRSHGNVCPTCREEFPSDTEYCSLDGNRLVPWTSESGIGPTGGVCPLCGQGFDPGVLICPKHQEPLVPALVQAERRLAPAVTRRICPVCGTQFPGDSQFCGKCGAALVPVN